MQKFFFEFRTKWRASSPSVTSGRPGGFFRRMEAGTASPGTGTSGAGIRTERSPGRDIS